MNSSGDRGDKLAQLKREGLRPPQPVLVADLFPEILSELLKMLSSLSEQEWQAETACEGWTVKDVALHLLGGEVGNLARRRDGHMVEASIHNWDELVRFINAWNQEWVAAARRISGRLLIDLLALCGGQMCEYFQSLEPHATGEPVAWAGEGPAPVWLDVAREYSERWHHQQHIREAVGKPGLMEPHYLWPVLATFARALPRAFRSRSAAEGRMVTVEIAGEAGGRWSIVREGGEWRLYEGGGEQADAKVVIDEDTAWRVFTRGVGPEEARDMVKVEGDEELGLHVLEVAAIIA